MTPEKLENQLKESLQKREVTPSADSWDRIAARLDAVQKPARRRRGWAYLAAAGLLLLLGLRLLFPTAPEPATDGVVASPMQPEFVSPTDQEGQFAEPEDTLANTDGQTGEDRDSESPEAHGAGGAMPPDGQAPARSILATLDQPALKTPIEPGLTPVPEGVAVSEGRPGPVTDPAIDALLRGAQDALTRQQDGPLRAEVDAMDLLDRAEDELDQTFREKIMEKLKSGVSKFRSGVADRNK